MRAGSRCAGRCAGFGTFGGLLTGGSTRGCAGLGGACLLPGFCPLLGTPFGCLFCCGLLTGGSTRGCAGLGAFGGAFFGTPLGCQPGGLALGGCLFRRGLLYRGTPGCSLGLTLCLFPRSLSLGGTLGGELGLPLGFLPGFLPGQPGGLPLGGCLFGGLLRRFPGGLSLGGALFGEPLCPLGGCLCGGLALGGCLFGL